MLVKCLLFFSCTTRLTYITEQCHISSELVGNCHRRPHSDLNFFETGRNTLTHSKKKPKKQKPPVPQPLPVFGPFMQCQILKFFKVLASIGSLT